MTKVRPRNPKRKPIKESKAEEHPAFEPPRAASDHHLLAAQTLHAYSSSHHISSRPHIERASLHVHVHGGSHRHRPLPTDHRVRQGARDSVKAGSWKHKKVVALAAQG